MDNFNPYADPLFGFTEQGVRLLNNGAGCFIFESGPFFTGDLTLTSNGSELYEGKDFIFILPFKEATHRTAMRIYGGVYLFDGEQRLPTLEAISLGSRYHADTEAVKLLLQDKTVAELLTTNYDDVITNSYVPPVKIEYDKDIWYGEEQLRNQIEVLKEAIGNKKVDDSIGYALLISVVNSLEAVITNPIIEQHLLNKLNAHNTTPEELGLRRRNLNALDSTRIFGYTKEELISLIRSTLPDESALAGKLTSDGGQIQKLKLSDQLSLIAGDGFVIDSYDGQLGIDVRSNLSVGTDSLETIIRVGDNVLRIDAAAKKVFLNDDELVTTGNIDQIIADVSNLEADIKTEDTESIVWSGDGSSDNPLVPSLKESFLLSNGYDYLTSSSIENSPLGVAPAAVKPLSDALERKLVKGQQLCGMTWGGDINITKENVEGLDKVENYSDANMPLSDLASAELAKYSIDGHTHTQNEVSPSYAGELTTGLFTYSPYNAMNTAMLGTLVEGYQTRKETLDQMLSSSAFEVVYVNSGLGALIEGVVFENFTLKLPELDYYVSGKKVVKETTSLDLTTLAEHISTYVFVAVDLQTMTYSLSNQPDPSRLNLGWVYTDSFGIRIHELREITAVLNSATHRGHVLNTNDPHLVRLDKTFLGLDKVSNLPPVVAPHSTIDGYATTLTMLKVSSEHNSLFRFVIRLTDELKEEIKNGDIKQYIVDNYLVRQLGDVDPVPLVKDTIVVQVIGGHSIKVSGSLPADGFVESGKPLPPDEKYPIGSYYYTYEPVNPGTYLGGEWDPVDTLDIPEELRQYWQLEVGAQVTLVDEYVTKNDNYIYVVLLPEPEYNGEYATPVVVDGVEKLQINCGGSPVDSVIYDYHYSDDGARTHVLVEKTAGILTPLEDPKYVWIRVA